MFRETPLRSRSERSERFISTTVAKPVLQDFILRRREQDEDSHIARLTLSQQPPPEPDRGAIFLASMADDDRAEAVETDFRVVDLSTLGAAANFATMGRNNIVDTGLLRPVGATAGVPLLAGFSFTRINAGDHHLREVAVLPTAGGYSVTFRDDSPTDDNYGASVQTFNVPEANVISRHSKRFDDAVGLVDVRREPGQAVLCGFSFKYKDSDHHIRHLQIGVSGGRIRMAMRDNDRNRRFEATVEYALITD